MNHPSEQALSPEPAGNQQATPKKNEALRPERHNLETLKEAPLVQKKVLVTKPVEIFKTQQELEQGVDGRLDRNVPVLLHVIEAQAYSTDGYKTYRIANSYGEETGWIRLPLSQENGYEWSTNQVWSPGETAIPTFYPSPDAAGSKMGGSPLPKELNDSDYAFPVLKRDDKNGLLMIGRPFPSTLSTNQKFPVWIRGLDQGKESFLVDKLSLDKGIQNLEYVIQAWSKLDGEKRKDATQVGNLLSATKMTICTLASGNNANSSSLDDLNSSLSFLGENFFAKLIGDDVHIMDDGEFEQYLGTLKEVLSRLQAASRSDTSYSVQTNNKRTSRRVKVVW